jgi:hypothetical protein
MTAAADAHFVPRRLQRGDGVPPDEAPTAQYQNSHLPIHPSDISVLTEIYDGRRLQASPKNGSR